LKDHADQEVSTSFQIVLSGIEIKLGLFLFLIISATPLALDYFLQSILIYTISTKEIYKGQG